MTNLETFLRSCCYWLIRPGSKYHADAKTWGTLNHPASVLPMLRMRNSFFRAVGLGDFSLITNKITKDTHATKNSLFTVTEKGGERCKILCPWGDFAFCAGNMNLSSSFAHCLFPATGSQKVVLRGGKLGAPQKGITEQWRLGTEWYNIARCQIRSHYSKISNKIPISHSTGR